MYLQVKDNSGIKVAKLLKIKRSKQKLLVPGRVAVVFPTKFKYVKQVARHKYDALILMTRRRIRRNFHYIKGPYSGVILFSRPNHLLGSRIFGPTYRELCHFCSPRNYLNRRLFARIAGRLV